MAKSKSNEDSKISRLFCSVMLATVGVNPARTFPGEETAFAAVDTEHCTSTEETTDVDVVSAAADPVSVKVIQCRSRSRNDDFAVEATDCRCWPITGYGSSREGCPLNRCRSY